MPTISKKEQIFEGVAASPGVVVGQVFVFNQDEAQVQAQTIRPAEVAQEIARFEDALIATRRELLAIRRELADRLQRRESDLFDAHLLVVEDRALIEEVIRGIEDRHLNSEYIFQEVIQRYAQAFSQVEDDYIRERFSDIKDVARRVLHNLTGGQRNGLDDLSEKAVVIAHDISPSDTATMGRNLVIGFATDVGGRTSHTAIMARSLAIPAVVGVGMVSLAASAGDKVVVDGNRGRVILNPSKSTLKKIEQEQNLIAKYDRDLRILKNKPAETKDGYRVTLAANIEMPGDIESVLENGAEGVGLYRTEYLYLNRDDLPTEDEQFEAYHSVAKQAGDNSVIIRTVDVGGDKFASPLDISREMNPFLGWRAVRFCLERQDIFKTQLRAILKASARGNIKVMFPMISGYAELLRVLEVWDEAKKELDKNGEDYNPRMEVGIMIEVPSAVMIAEVLARQVDFFSIGTNDLIQYTLAVDRINEKIAYLYEPLHPAVLCLIRKVIDTAHRNDVWVGMCGEMAGDPLTVPILLGMGLDEFSVSPVAVPTVKKVIRSLRLAQARGLVKEVMEYRQAEEVRTAAQRFMAQLDSGASPPD